MHWLQRRPYRCRACERRFYRFYREETCENEAKD
jgi:hypothetical protein